jgi:hypothetical protein
MTRFLPIALLLFPLTLAAQDLTQLEKMLVPVLNQGGIIEGANGSRFQTSFGMWAGEPFLLTYYPALPGDGSDQPVVRTIDVRPSGAVNIWEPPVIAKGRFLFVDETSAKRPMFAHVISTRPDGIRATTPLPVVKSQDVLTGKSTFGWIVNDAILAFPPDPLPPLAHFAGYRQRHTLRVYDWDSTGDLQVIVRLSAGTYWQSLGGVISRIIDVRSRDFDDVSYPYYAEVNLEQLFGASDWCAPHSRLRCDSFWAVIEVEPVNPTARYYAFISTTDNDTGHVTMHTPR